jgi:hypothetical protein
VKFVLPCNLKGGKSSSTNLNLGKFAKSAHEFAVYIKSNTSSLINYGERFRAGERISSCLAESTVNAVISKRCAKRQQMQWTKRGAHLLLQIRTRTLDRSLRPLFERWYPGSRTTIQPRPPKRPPREYPTNRHALVSIGADRDPG